MPMVRASLLQLAWEAFLNPDDAISLSLELDQVGCSSGRSKHQARQEGEKPERPDLSLEVDQVEFSPGSELLSSHPD